MVNQQLLDYIKQQTALGKSKDEIRSALLNAGWHAEDVEQGLSNPDMVPMPSPINSRLPKARQILTESWVIYKARFKTLITIAIVPLLGYAIVGFILGAGYLGLSSTANAIPKPVIYLGVFVLALVFIYVAIWGSVAGLYAIKDAGEQIGWQEAFKRAQPKIMVFFTTGLLSGLAIFGGFILFIIPGIIFALWFSQSPYIVLEEGLSNSAALKRSKYYVKGRIGEIFGKLFYIGMITLVIYLILIIILAVLGSLINVKYQDISWVTNIFSIIWTPLVTVFSYQVYRHSKATRP
jgi:hypothetical protein